MLSVVVAILLVVSLFVLNAWLYKANKNTPVPEGCENLQPDCKGCGIKDCAVRKEESKGE